MEKAETKAEGTATNATNKARDDTRAICVDGKGILRLSNYVDQDLISLLVIVLLI